MCTVGKDFINSDCIVGCWSSDFLLGDNLVQVKYRSDCKAADGRKLVPEAELVPEVGLMPEVG